MPASQGKPTSLPRDGLLESLAIDLLGAIEDDLLDGVHRDAFDVGEGHPGELARLFLERHRRCHADLTQASHEQRLDLVGLRSRKIGGTPAFSTRSTIAVSMFPREAATFVTGKYPS